MKTWSMVGMALPAVILIVSCIVSYQYTGHVPTNEAMWLLCGALAVSAIAYVGAHIRDTLAANQEAIVTQLETRLSSIENRLSNLEAGIVQYGDRREVSGQMTAAQVVNGSPLLNGRRSHLMPVDDE